MRNYNGIDEAALDRHITGNYGEDYFIENCARPGKNGCGYCDACEDYQQMMEDRYDRMRDDPDYWRD